MARKAGVHGEDPHPLAVVAGVGVRRALQRAQEQAGRDQQHQRHRDLRADEHVPQLDAAAIGRAVLAVQRGDDVEARGAQRRCESEEQGGDERRSRTRSPASARPPRDPRRSARGSVGMNECRNATIHQASAMLATAASDEQRRGFGEQLQRPGVPRPAPTARRVAISRRRAMARARSMPATLLHAIASTISGERRRGRPRTRRRVARNSPGTRADGSTAIAPAAVAVRVRLLQRREQRVQLVAAPAVIAHARLSDARCPGARPRRVR